VRHAVINADAWLDLIRLPGNIPAAPYLYCAGGEIAGSDWHARMFAPWDGISEDPATGSAAAALAGALTAFEKPVDGKTAYVIEQGVEMGRPSFIALMLSVSSSALDRVSIGGAAVKIAEGRLFA
jgi:trans-2,3-dihydro-3-hydroxyanthranilate isomerase